jgi:hypothetical protein
VVAPTTVIPSTLSKKAILSDLALKASGNRVTWYEPVKERWDLTLISNVTFVVEVRFYFI